MDRLDVVLADLGQGMGMNGLAFSGDECRLEYGDRSVDVIADRTRGRLVLAALVADLPAGERAEVLGYLLDLNTGPLLGGAALGVPAASDAVMLTDQIAADELSPQWLLARVKAFMDAIDLARSLLVASRSPAPEAGPESASSFMIRA